MFRGYRHQVHTTCLCPLRVVFLRVQQHWRATGNCVVEPSTSRAGVANDHGNGIKVIQDGVDKKQIVFIRRLEKPSRSPFPRPIWFDLVYYFNIRSSISWSRYVSPSAFVCEEQAGHPAWWLTEALSLGRLAGWSCCQRKLGSSRGYLIWCLHLLPVYSQSVDIAPFLLYPPIDG